MLFIYFQVNERGHLLARDTKNSDLERREEEQRMRREEDEDEEEEEESPDDPAAKGKDWNGLTNKEASLLNTEF